MLFLPLLPWASQKSFEPTFYNSGFNCGLVERILYGEINQKTIKVEKNNKKS